MSSLEGDLSAVSVVPNDDRSKERVNSLGYPVLQPVTPVPSDITISQQIVRDVGLLPIQDVAKQ